MSKAIDLYVGQEEQQRQQVEEVRSSLATHRGDPPPGVSQADLNTAVREAQSQPQQTSVATQQTQETEGIQLGSGTPGVAKQDLGSKVGVQTMEKQSDASKAVEKGLGNEGRADLGAIKDTFREQVDGEAKTVTMNDVDKTREDRQAPQNEISPDLKSQAAEVAQPAKDAGAREVQTERSSAVDMYVPEQQQRAEREPEPKVERETEPEPER